MSWDIVLLRTLLVTALAFQCGCADEAAGSAVSVPPWGVVAMTLGCLGQSIAPVEQTA